MIQLNDLLSRKTLALMAIGAAATVFLYLLAGDDGVVEPLDAQREVTAASHGVGVETDLLEGESLGAASAPVVGDAVRAVPSDEEGADLEVSRPPASVVERARKLLAFTDADEDYLRGIYLREYSRASAVELQDDQELVLEQIHLDYLVTLEPMVDEAVERMSQCWEDYYGNAKYPCQPESAGALVARESEGSHYSTDATMVVDGWSLDLGFRSSDYPGLNLLLEEIVKVRDQRDLEIRTFLGEL